MANLTGYGAYLLFVALKTHFNVSTYDFFKHNGKLRANKQSYEKRNDKYFFEKIAKQYKAEDLRDFYVANLLEGKIYVTDLLEDEAVENYRKYIARRQALTYNYKNDLDQIFRYGTKVAFEITDVSYPEIVTLCLRKNVSLETLVIVDDLTGFSKKFNKYLGEDDVVWGKVAMKIGKYKPFLKYDKDKFKSILKEKVDESIRGTRI